MRIRDGQITVSGRRVTMLVKRLCVVLTSEEAIDIALEYGFNPVVDDEKAFDILPE